MDREVGLWVVCTEMNEGHQTHLHHLTYALQVCHLNPTNAHFEYAQSFVLLHRGEKQRERREECWASLESTLHRRWQPLLATPLLPFCNKAASYLLPCCRRARIPPTRHPGQKMCEGLAGARCFIEAAPRLRGSSVLGRVTGNCGSHCDRRRFLACAHGHTLVISAHFWEAG